ncbi:MAG: hypothetical protein GEV06_07050 [Luteitalea sp.]|nr:hypothetical protein [Luteitalea sp.]
MKTLTVRFALDESGHWIATLPRVKGCHSYGRTLEEAERRIREALELFRDDVDTIAFKPDVRLPAVARRVVRQARVARKRAAEQQASSAQVARQAVKLLTERLHLSRRDAGRLLALSHQRVQQLAR